MFANQININRMIKKLISSIGILCLSFSMSVIFTSCGWGTADKVCPKCMGSGKAMSTVSDTYVNCSECGGSGKVR